MSEKVEDILKKFAISLDDKIFLKNVLLGFKEDVLQKYLKYFCNIHIIKENKLISYFKQLLFNNIDQKYIQDRIDIGIVHEKIGLSAITYISTFSKWIDLIYPSIKEIVSGETLGYVLLILFKNILLDISIAIDACQNKHIERYQIIFDSIEDALVTVDIDTGLINMVNKKMEEILDMPKAELCNKKILDICSLDIDILLKDKLKQIYLKTKKENIPVAVSISLFEHSGRKYVILTFKDLREEIKRRRELEVLGRLYNTLSAINILVTTVENKDNLFKRVVSIIKNKGEFKYVGIFKKYNKVSIAEMGSYIKTDPLLCIPFKGSREEYILNVAISKDMEFTEKEKNLLEEIVHDISFALEKLKRQEKLSHLAYYDDVTQLPNRIYFSQRLKEMINRVRAKTSKVALIIVAINKFAELAYTLGHFWKNEIIKAVALRIKSKARDRDLIARLNEDKFAIAVDSNNIKTVVMNIIGRIRKAFEEPIYFNGNDIMLELAFGIAIFPYDAETPEELISNAMLSSDKSIELGGNTEVFYSEELTKSLKDRVSIRTALRRALNKNEFVVYYQPKIELATGKLKGAEALIRWIKDGEIIPPYKFIPILEEGDLIHDVGKWVIKETCTQIKNWKVRGIDLDISVNVSPVQLRSFSFMEDLMSTISSCGLSNLEIELTESAIMEDISKSISFLNTLLEMGVKTYIDDFGTGYSSLAYLKKLPVYAVKIDREFIKDIPAHKEDIEIIKAAISLAKTYGMKTVAEGPETEEQIKILRELGCDFAQGYYFSYPLPAHEFEKYVINFSNSSSPSNESGEGT